jgi:hypothetical protein
MEPTAATASTVKAAASASTVKAAAASTVTSSVIAGDCRDVRHDAKRAHRNACRQNAYRSLLHGTFPTESTKAVGVAARATTPRTSPITVGVAARANTATSPITTVSAASF